MFFTLIKILLDLKIVLNEYNINFKIYIKGICIMKYYIILISLISPLLIGCLSKPDTVKDIYLKEINTGEKVLLESIETNIITKKREIDASKKEMIIAKQIIAVNQAEISLIKKTLSLFHEKEKLHSMTDDREKLSEIRLKIKNNEKKTIESNKRLNFNILKQDNIKKLIELKKAEIAILIASLNYEKAKIGKKFQSSRSEEFGDDSIDIKKYKKFLIEHEKTQKKKQIDYNKSCTLLNNAKK